MNKKIKINVGRDVGTKGIVNNGSRRASNTVVNVGRGKKVVSIKYSSSRGAR